MSIYTKILKDLFQKDLNQEVFEARTRVSLEWYRKKIQTYYGNTSLKLDTKIIPHTPINHINPGWMYSFKYNPKHKDKLPYYDLFPLVLIIKPVPGGFLGLNFHYLRPVDRAFFMDALYKFETPDTRNNTLRINITYNILQSSRRMRFYKACIKRYRYYNIGNFFLPVTPEEWDMALFLPTERFKNETKKDIWEDSRSKY